MLITKEQIEIILRNEYNNIWKDWYSSDGKLIKATLKIEIGGYTSFYNPTEDCIYLYIAEGNFSDFEYQIKGERNMISKLGWYIHQTELVHEMIHEYQFKMIKEPSKEGIALLVKKGQIFDGLGHDEKFFSAIVEKSSYFNLSPEEFLAEL